FAAGFSPSSVVVGDFNGDGRLDLAVANAGLDAGLDTGYGSTVSVLLGNVDGTFQPARNFDTNNYGRSVAVGDVNGDGRLDLAVANASFDAGYETVTILAGNVDATLHPMPPFGPDDTAGSVSVG